MLSGKLLLIFDEEVHSIERVSVGLQEINRK